MANFEKLTIYGRFSFLYVNEPYTPEGTASGKYSASILIPKSDKEQAKKLWTSIKEYGERYMRETNKKLPQDYVSKLMRDGDTMDTEKYPSLAGHWVLKAKTSKKPVVVHGRDMQPITNPEDIYPGAWGYMSFSLFGYDSSGNRGVTALLNSLWKTRDDENLGGNSDPVARAMSDFAGITCNDFSATSSPFDDNAPSAPSSPEVPFPGDGGGDLPF